MRFLGIVFLAINVILWSCSKENGKYKQFEEVSLQSGIVFNNQLSYTEEFNPYTYRNFFNGGGVALGDVNNDGLVDVYLTGNMVDNRLFLNKGNWQFEDITVKAGVACSNVWSSGATFSDINGDGLLDLYVCKSGKPGGDNRHNELFINNGDLTFSERSKEYGLDIEGLSTHAAFFDYDKDGDLDCYILTNSIRSIGGFDLIKDQRNIPDPDGAGNKLMRNDGGKFSDVTIESGIYTSNIGFGLGITLSDFNLDGWTDIFISNDFFERDYLYLNNQDGTFSEELESNFKSISMGSMGADAADLDNDSYPDIIVTEMLPTSIERQRTKTVFEDWNKHQLNLKTGYYYQYPRNVLHRNQGGKGFLEIGRYANVSATEWSWGALSMDIDNDGLRDIFISNGINKDLLDRDYLTYMANDEQVRNLLKQEGEVITKLIDIMPSEPVPNCIFKNTGNLSFEDHAQEWNLGEASFSNGSAYGDLDNDGDLDLVVNNVNMRSFVYRNNLDTMESRSMRIKLVGDKLNKFAIGAKVMAYVGDKTYMVENYPSRGFESSVDPILHVGIGNSLLVDSMVINWPEGQESKHYNVPTNKLVTASISNSRSRNPSNPIPQSSPFKLSDQNPELQHVENNFVDFDRDRLLPWMFHNEGPALAVGDVNGDGTEDFFLGGAKGQGASLVFSMKQGFRIDRKQFELDSMSEDTDASFGDIDGDGDLDLIVTSGGRAFSKNSSALKDRLYMNNGNGSFEKKDLNVYSSSSTSTVALSDFDNDGDIDAFIGIRFHPFYYGQGGSGILLQNDGTGNFKNVTSNLAEKLSEIGMVTDAAWADLNNDGFDDLAIVGDWQPIRILYGSENGQFNFSEISETSGWWNAIHLADVNGDDQIDIVAGNHGTNSFFQAGTRMYIADFDKNGSLEQIICSEEDGKYYPVVDRNELIAQLPVLKKQILYYKDYAEMSMTDLFDESTLSKAEIFETHELESSIYLNEQGEFKKVEGPSELQYGPIYDVLTHDVNNDGHVDIIVGGNQYLVKPQFGRYDALPAGVLYGSADGVLKDFSFLPVDGQVRSIKTLDGNKKRFVFAKNDGNLEILEKVED